MEDNQIDLNKLENKPKLNRSFENVHNENSDSRFLNSHSKSQKIENQILEKEENQINKIDNNIKEMMNNYRKSYSDNFLINQVKKDYAREDKLKKMRKKNKIELIEERQKIHKSFINSLTFIHSALFIAIIFLQYEVILRHNIRNVLFSYFKNINDTEIERDENSLNYPLIVFNNLVDLIEYNGFWFYDKKYEIVTNIRVTERININDNYTSVNLILSNDLKQRINSITINNYEIDPYSGFNKDIEFKGDIENNYKYQIKDSK